jgi:predicted enzyme related to lactoylglutathione lyase
MTTVEKHEPGTFCWVELATTDLDAGRKFYEGIFGWKGEVKSFEGFGDYCTFAVADGRGAAGGYPQPDAERSMGVPPHWNLYIYSDEVDKDAAKATELGGQVTVPPMDLQMGRMAVIADPTGARFCLWHSEQMPGFQVRGEHGAFVWADLITPDKDKAREFYGGLFGWSWQETGEEFGNYTIVSNGEEQIGGFMNPMQPGTPPNWMIYFAVDEAQATFDAATKGGAQTMMPVTPIPTIGEFAVQADPQGAVFAILQALPRNEA